MSTCTIFITTKYCGQAQRTHLAGFTFAHSACAPPGPLRSSQYIHVHRGQLVGGMYIKTLAALELGGLLGSPIICSVLSYVAIIFRHILHYLSVTRGLGFQCTDNE